LCIVSRLGSMLPQLRPDAGKLRQELVDYQVLDSMEMPKEERVDRFWGFLGKDESFSQQRFSSSERTSSVVKKIALHYIYSFGRHFNPQQLPSEGRHLSISAVGVSTKYNIYLISAR